VSLNPGLKLTQLAAILGIARSGAVIVVDALEELGYMTREPAPDDRRAFSLTLTDKGRDDLVKLTDVVRQQDAEVGQALTTAEQQMLHTLLLKLCGNPG